MNVGAKDLRTRTAEILKAVEEGELVTVTYRGRPVAEIRPIGQPDVAGEAEDDVFGMWSRRDDLEEPGEWVRELRRRRVERSS